jgi:hypothetical protein
LSAPYRAAMRAFLAATLVVLFVLPASALPAAKPLRPPNGTYVYAMSVAGSTVLNSTIVVEGIGSTFSISETTKLPSGAIATTISTWSSDTLLPQTFALHQGKITLRARITRAALQVTGMQVSFPRIPGTSYVLPSVGLMATELIFPYVISAHPGESLTLAEIQNNQTVLVRPDSAPSPAVGPAGDIAIAVIKEIRNTETTRIRSELSPG